MAKKSEHVLLWPPRYHSGDLRNLARIPAGVLFGMQLVGHDLPVRRLLRHKESLEVTIPPQVWEILQLEPGHYLLFGATHWPGVTIVAGVTEQDPELLDIIKRKDCELVARKVTRHNRSLRVTIPPEILEIIAAVPGDLLIFGLTAVTGVISMAVVKGGGESTGSRRTG